MSNNVCIRVLADEEQLSRCKERIETKSRLISKLSSVLALAGNEVRMKILYLLFEENELCVCDLSDVLGMTISAVSQHLRKLKDGNILDVRKEGPTYYYYIKKNHQGVLESFFTIINEVKN